MNNNCHVCVCYKVTRKRRKWSSLQSVSLSTISFPIETYQTSALAPLGPAIFWQIRSHWLQPKISDMARIGRFQMHCLWLDLPNKMHSITEKLFLKQTANEKRQYINKYHEIYEHRNNQQPHAIDTLTSRKKPTRNVLSLEQQNRMHQKTNNSELCTRWSIKRCHFYVYYNFGKCGLLLIILSLLHWQRNSKQL